MGRIHVLGDHLINRIAAGEVVERPASVVKELTENAVDAGATRIDVDVEAGGRRRIAVSDDGVGMDRDDALLALERHATSKLRHPNDLDAIATLGFRGEALPSIAAVSRFRLTTAPADGEGTEIEVHGGRIVAVRDVGAPRGTKVSVERLFYNVPARRKFLRGEGTEWMHVARVVTRLALAHPAVTFRLRRDGVERLAVVGGDDDAARVGAVLGRDGARGLLPVAIERDGVRVTGWSGRPVDATTRRDRQYVFVNRRPVHDRVLAHAVRDAYGNTVPKGHHPALVLFVDVDPETIDVNVHPQKSEIRFRRAHEVHDVLRDGLHAALADRAAVPTLRDLRPSPGGAAAPAGPSADAPTPEAGGLDWFTIAERATDGFAAPIPPADTPNADVAPISSPPGSTPNVEVATAPTAHSVQTAIETVAPAREPRILDEVGAPRAIAQYLDSYIVAQDEEGLLLVDQHAAHERVLFERMLAAAEHGEIAVQRLLTPVTIELGTDEYAAYERERDEFGRIGFLVEPFGERAVRVDGVPAEAANTDPVRLFRELCGDAARVRTARADVANLRHRLVTTAACHAAIKIRRPLRLPEMQGLLEDLYRVDNPTTCPHGRPAQFRVTLDEIERAFKRR